MAPKIKKLGELLVERGVISLAQLDEALQSQVAFGGKLGTNLVELGYISLDEIAVFLGQALGTPLPPTDWLENPDPAALRALPVTLVRRFNALPLRIDARTIHIAMVDPTNPEHVSDIAFATSRRLQTYLIPELRMHYWLERHYGIKRDVRYINIGREMARGRFQQPEVPKKPELPRRETDPRETSPVRDERAQDARSLVMGQELTDDRSFEQAYAGSFGKRSATPPTASPALPAVQPQPQAPPPTSVVSTWSGATPAIPTPTILDLELEMARGKDRDQIGGAALRLARVYTETAALFVVHQGIVRGVRGVGATLDGHPIDGIVFPLSCESVITIPAASGEIFRGPANEREYDARLLEALGRVGVGEVAVFPVKIRERVVNVLYVDNGPRRIAITAFAALAALAEGIAAAYERLIFDRKRSGSQD